jgi:Spy/CpxP family protein refolding chaperone
MRGGPTLDQLTQQLSLTDDQKAKVKIVLDARDQKLKDLRADTTLSPEDRRAQMQAIRQDVTAQLKAILTPEQFAKYQKMTPMGRGPRNGPPPGGNPPPAGTPPPAAPPQQ